MERYRLFLTISTSILGIFLCTACTMVFVPVPLPINMIIDSKSLAESTVVNKEPENVISTAAPTVNTTDNTTITVMTDNGEAIFSNESSDETNPADVLQEVLYATGGFGFDGTDCSQAPNLATFDGLSSKAEVAFPLEMYTCGWQPQEQITVKIMFPDGTEKYDFIQSIPDPYSMEAPTWAGIYTYFPDIINPTGTYIISLTGTSGTATHFFEVVESHDPRLYIIEAGSKLALNNFFPNENVRIIAFSGTTFAAWQGYRVNSDGKYVILNRFGANGPLIFVAIGEKSGIAKANLADANLLASDPIWHFECPGAPPSRLGLGFAKVITLDGVPAVDLYDSNHSVVETFEEGTLIDVGTLTQPTCVDGTIWVSIENSNLSFPENNGNEYLVEPAN